MMMSIELCKEFTLNTTLYQLHEDDSTCEGINFFPNLTRARDVERENAVAVPAPDFTPSQHYQSLAECELRLNNSLCNG